MKISDYTNRRPGRPRSEKAHRAILEATRALLLESGIHGISIEGVAARAGVGKTTIYRRWKSKEELLSDAIGTLADDIEIPDTGHTLTDFIAVLNGMMDAVNDIAAKSPLAVQKVVAGIIDNEQLMDVYWEQFAAPRREALAHILQKGIARGEIRPDVDVEDVIDIVGGAYFYALLFKKEKIDPAHWLQKTGALLMRGIAAEATKTVKNTSNDATAERMATSNTTMDYAIGDDTAEDNVDEPNGIRSERNKR